MRDETRHPDVRVVDVRRFDAMWKHESFFSGEERRVLIRGTHGLNETWPETSRFDWILSNDPIVRRTGLRVLADSNAIAYHWHNRWKGTPKIGSAHKLYENYFECVLEGPCAALAAALRKGIPYGPLANVWKHKSNYPDE